MSVSDYFELCRLHGRTIRATVTIEAGSWSGVHEIIDIRTTPLRRGISYHIFLDRIEWIKINADEPVALLEGEEKGQPYERQSSDL